jgi:D-galactarolactone cycloisomerase
MKITKADAILTSIPFQPTGMPLWNWGGKVHNRFDTLLVRIETEDGTVGWGEAFSRSEDTALLSAIRTRLLPLILGKDASRISAIKYELEFNQHNFGRISGIMNGISAIDTALWDILGKQSGRPLAEILGGRHADTLPAYASLLRYGEERSLVETVEQAIARGYRFIKLHDIEHDLIVAAYEAANGRAQLMLDVNCPWTVPEALSRANALRKLDLLWLEEPVWPPENYRGLAALRKQGIHRIASGENAGSVYDFSAMIDAGALDIAQPDVAKTGGITELLKIRAVCETAGVDFVPHCALFGPGQLATIHINATTRSLPVFERLYCDFEEDLYHGATVPVDGKVKVPTTPGLGLDPDPHIIDRYRVA